MFLRSGGKALLKKKAIVGLDRFVPSTHLIISIRCDHTPLPVVFILQGLTIDSQVTDGAPPRRIHGEVVSNIKEWYAKNNKAHYRFIQEQLKSHDAYIAEAIFADSGAQPVPTSEEL